MREKQIQIPKRFLINTMLLLSELEDLNLSENAKDIISYLESEIDAKIEREKRREVFTQYKTSDGQERERSRREYLEMSGYSKDWISEKETPF